MITTLAKLTFDNADPAWFWIGLCILSVVVLVLTYRGIYQRSGRKLTWALFGLRLIGVIALLISLVKPAWMTIFTKSEKPRVAVVLDDSQSMSILHRVSGSEKWSTRYQQAVAWLTESPAGQSLPHYPGRC